VTELDANYDVDDAEAFMNSVETQGQLRVEDISIGLASYAVDGAAED
jgi:hypothetical protein